MTMHAACMQIDGSWKLGFSYGSYLAEVAGVPSLEMQVPKPLLNAGCASFKWPQWGT